MAAWVRLAAPVFIRMLRTWLAAVLPLMWRRAPISWLLRPAARRRSTSSSRSVRPSGPGDRLGRLDRFQQPNDTPLADRLGDLAGLPGQVAGPALLSDRRREQSVVGESLGDVHDRPHPPVHLERGDEVPLGGGVVAQERGDPSEEALRAPECGDQRPRDEVHAAVLGEARPQRPQGV